MKVKSDIIQGVINRAKTAVRNFGDDAKIELPAELVKNICQNLNAERYRLAQLNKKHSVLTQQMKSRQGNVHTYVGKPIDELGEDDIRALGDKYIDGLVHGYICYSISGIPIIVGEIMACDKNKCILSYWAPVEKESLRVYEGVKRC